MLCDVKKCSSFWPIGIYLFVFVNEEMNFKYLGIGMVIYSSVDVHGHI